MRVQPPIHRRGLLRLIALLCAVVASAGVAGCGGGGSPTTPASAGSSTTPGSRTLAITVTGSSVSPAPSTVELPVGKTLVLTITSDHADDVHVHGFEVEKEVKAGGSVTFVLTGKDSGVYEVEMHDPALTLVKIAVS